MNNKTSVIFRTFRKGGDVIALFPYVPADDRGWFCMSYQSIGQHGAATPNLMREATRPAHELEIAPLREELGRIGYTLREMRKFPRTAYNVRKKAAFIGNFY